MKRPKLGDMFWWKKKLAKIVAIAECPTVVVEVEDSIICPHCGKVVEEKHQFSVIPTSPLFQENAEPIQTLEE